MNATVTLTPEQVLQAHNIHTIPFLVILYVLCVIGFGIPGLILVKKSGKKFLMIWTLGAILSGIGLFFTCYFPNSVQYIINLFS